MFYKITLDQALGYHAVISWVMYFFILLFSFLGYYLNRNYKESNYIRNISFLSLEYSGFPTITIGPFRYAKC